MTADYKTLLQQKAELEAKIAATLTAEKGGVITKDGASRRAGSKARTARPSRSEHGPPTRAFFMAAPIARTLARQCQKQKNPVLFT